MPSSRMPFVDISVFLLIFSACLGAVQGAADAKTYIAGNETYLFGFKGSELINTQNMSQVSGTINSSGSEMFTVANSTGPMTFWSANILPIVNWVVAALNFVRQVATACLALGSFIGGMFPWIPPGIIWSLNFGMWMSYMLGIAQFLSNRNLRG